MHNSKSIKTIHLRRSISSSPSLSLRSPERDPSLCRPREFTQHSTAQLRTMNSPQQNELSICPKRSIRPSIAHIHANFASPTQASIPPVLYSLAPLPAYESELQSASPTPALASMHRLLSRSSALQQRRQLDGSSHGISPATALPQHLAMIQLLSAHLAGVLQY
jgi:hypothetical protein